MLFRSVALFADPVARECFDALTRWGPSELREHADERVSDLLARLAVEEIEADEELELLARRVVVNLVEAAGRRLLSTLLRREDERSIDVKLLLDALANARSIEHWDAAEDAASQLVAWIADDEEAA